MLQFAANTYRAFRTLSWLFIVLGIGGAAMFLTSQHYSRVALESYTPVQASSLYAELPPLAPVVSSSIGEVKAILEPYNELPRRYDLAIVQSDSPEECLQAFATGRVMDCYGMSLSAIEQLKGYDVEARMWNLTGTDGFGGNGHNVIEYHNKISGRWEMIDPNYSCYIVRKGEETVLSVAEFREMLMTNDLSFEVRYYESSVEQRTPASLIAEYRELTPSASLFTAEDFRERYDTRYASLMPMAGLLDKLPLSVKRGVRSFLMGSSDSKLLIEDSFTPVYHLGALKLLWLLSLTMLVLGITVAAAPIFQAARRTVRFAPLAIRRKLAPERTSIA